jgi:hypothetical protein
MIGLAFELVLSLCLELISRGVWCSVLVLVDG